MSLRFPVSIYHADESISVDEIVEEVLRDFLNSWFFEESH